MSRVPRNAGAGRESGKREAGSGTLNGGRQLFVVKLLGGWGRDHRIVAWAPGWDGLVVNRRALEPGTAIKATTIFGSDPNPATPASAGVRRMGVAATETRLEVDSPGRPRRPGSPNARCVPRNAPKGFRATSPGQDGCRGTRQ
jgi:hypothetical protein